MIQITIKYFGMLEEITKTKEEILTFESELTSEKLSSFLLEKYPAFQQKKYKIAVNQKLLGAAVISINNGDEIAVLPPFAGG